LAPLRVIVDGSDAISCVNDYLRRQLLLAFPHVAARVKVIRNSTDIPPSARRQERTYLRTRTKWGDNDTIVVFIGLPREKKGIEALLHAMDLLADEPTIRLLIVGPDVRPELPGIVEAATRLKHAGRLFVTGLLSRADALEIAAQGDIVVMPSLEDGLPNGLLEGMALGLAPVASDILSDVVGPECGIVVPRGRPEPLAGALRKLASDAEMRRGLGDAARQRVSEYFCPRREIAEYLEVIKAVVGSRV
jgi:glycosyltransferase involved in cell wall biosynthesis